MSFDCAVSSYTVTIIKLPASKFSRLRMLRHSNHERFVVRAFRSFVFSGRLNLRCIMHDIHPTLSTA